MYLPAVQGDVSDDEPVTAEPVNGVVAALIVEDESALRELAAEFLATAVTRVLQAQNGPDAVATARSNQSGIDLLLIDVVMPVIERTRGR